LILAMAFECSAAVLATHLVNYLVKAHGHTQPPVYYQDHPEDRPFHVAPVVLVWSLNYVMVNRNKVHNVCPASSWLPAQSEEGVETHRRLTQRCGALVILGPGSGRAWRPGGHAGP